MISLRDIVETCLPRGDEPAISSPLLDREVTWATRPRPSPPAFGHLSGGELVLLRLSELADVDDRLTLGGAIRQLAGFNISGLAVAGSVTEKDRALAESRNVALIVLPAETDLGEVERRATHLIAERRRDRQRRGHEAGRRLMELAIAGEPLATVFSTLNQLSRQAVALEGRDGRLLTYFARPGQPGRETIEPLLAATSDAVRNWLAITSDASPAEPPTMHLALGRELDRTIAPVIGRDGLLGCLSLIGTAGAWSSEDALLASRGAAACAIVLAREYASIAARREIELNVLDEVLDGALRNEATLLQQARRLGHDLERPHALVVIDLDHGDPEVLRPAITVALDQIVGPSLWRLCGGVIEVVLPPTADPGPIVELLQRHLGLPGIMGGVGSAQAGLAGLQRSRHEARKALAVQRRLGIADAVADFSELGVYQLLFAAERLPEFDAFHDETLGVLITYDRENRAGLIETLRAWFNANGSPKDAARRLGVHRNTVLYRLERVRAVTGYDLGDAETRFRLQLAICMNAIRTSREGAPEREVRERAVAAD
jgi:PucR family transcriptional regulator, purine catabolism regulatory protein